MNDRMNEVIFAFFRDKNPDTVSKSLFSWPIADASSWTFWIIKALAARFPEVSGEFEFDGINKTSLSYSPLHIIAYCGFDVVLRSFIEYSKTDINVSTPQNDRLCHMLLDRGIQRC
jgi:hypothetical protein